MKRDKFERYMMKCLGGLFLGTLAVCGVIVLIAELAV